MANRTICWFSCGAASAVATKLIRAEQPDAIVAYCETGSEHPDNERFLAECSLWFSAPVERIRSEQYADTWAVWEKVRYLSGHNGAPCTREMKFVPRLNFQLPSDTHVFGYTADKLDAARAERMVETYPNMKMRFPLIEKGLKKENVLALIESAGIALPPMYAMGFQNNNCIPCVKSTSPAYWALVRQRFPAEFDRMAKLARELDCRLVIVDRVKDAEGKVQNVRGFIDDIPHDQATTNPVQPSCDFLCHFAEGLAA